MELQEVIKTRRSIRVFTDAKVEDKLIEKIIEAGNNAPSHCNTQGWKFIVIDDQNIKNEIFDNGGSFVIKNAPYGILILYNLGLSDNMEYQDWILSSAGAIENMLLTIHNLGLGGCSICHLPRKKTLSKILNIKKPYTPIAYIAFGYPKIKPVEVKRKNKTTDIYAKNSFKWQGEKIPFKIRVKRMGKKIYYRLPVFIKKSIYPMVDKFVKKFHN